MGYVIQSQLARGGLGTKNPPASGGFDIMKLHVGVLHLSLQESVSQFYRLILICQIPGDCITSNSYSYPEGVPIIIDVMIHGVIRGSQGFTKRLPSWIEFHNFPLARILRDFVTFLFLLAHEYYI